MSLAKSLRQAGEMNERVPRSGRVDLESIYFLHEPDACSRVSGSRRLFFMPLTRLQQLCFSRQRGEGCLGPVPIFEPASRFNIYAACAFTHAGGRRHVHVCNT